MPPPLKNERSRTLCANPNCRRQLCKSIDCSKNFCCFVCEDLYFNPEEWKKGQPRHGPACTKGNLDWELKRADAIPSKHNVQDDNDGLAVQSNSPRVPKVAGTSNSPCVPKVSGTSSSGYSMRASLAEKCESMPLLRPRFALAAPPRRSRSRSLQRDRRERAPRVQEQLKASEHSISRESSASSSYSSVSRWQYSSRSRSRSPRRSRSPSKVQNANDEPASECHKPAAASNTPGAPPGNKQKQKKPEQMLYKPGMGVRRTTPRRKIAVKSVPVDSKGPAEKTDSPDTLSIEEAGRNLVDALCSKPQDKVGVQKDAAVNESVKSAVTAVSLSDSYSESEEDGASLSVGSHECQSQSQDVSSGATNGIEASQQAQCRTQVLLRPRDPHEAPPPAPSLPNPQVAPPPPATWQQPFLPWAAAAVPPPPPPIWQPHILTQGTHGMYWPGGVPPPCPPWYAYPPPPWRPPQPLPAPGHPRFVHVLLSPNRGLAPEPNLKAGTVCVMGLHKSGTHAIIRYLTQYFDVTTQPKIKKRDKDDEGTVHVGDLQIWKHTVPLAPLEFPRQKEGVTIILMIREWSSWMLSLSEHAYEWYPVSMDRKSDKYYHNMHRKEGCLGWMLDEVYTRQSFHNPNSDRKFASIPDLWNFYARGYLEGKFTASNSGKEHGVVIVRHEDVVNKPQEVVDELQRLGLPRNTKVFEPINEYLSGRSRASAITRNDIIAKLEKRSRGETISSTVKKDLQKARTMIDRNLVDLLGYSLKDFQ